MTLNDAIGLLLDLYRSLCGNPGFVVEPLPDRALCYANLFGELVLGKPFGFEVRLKVHDEYTSYAIT